MEHKVVKKQRISPYLLVILSFLMVILVGSLLLSLPIAHRSRQWGNYVESLYIATSATCVTGFDSYVGGIGTELSLFGQIVMAIMIQIGGLGFITVFVFFVTLFRRRLSFRDRAFISAAVSSDTVAEVSKFVKKLFLVTVFIELIGAGLGIPAYLTVQDVPHAIWTSLFMSISAFNNAGFDILSGTSLILGGGSPIIDNLPTWAYYYIQSYMIILIVMGGISYLVIFEVFSFKKKPNQWRAFTKMCLWATFIIILSGTVLLILTEGVLNNWAMNPFQALFQTVSSRTAGFMNYDPYQLTVSGRIIVCVIMFIGGSPLGTAGGVKTTTIFIIILTIWCYVRGKKVAAFKRYYSQNMIVKSMAVFITSILIVMFGYLLISIFENGNSVATGEHVVYEVIAGFSTTGFTTELTATLGVGSKITMCVLMFLGRLGPMTMFQVFSSNMNVEADTHYRFVEEEILIG